MTALRPLWMREARGFPPPHRRRKLSQANRRSGRIARTSSDAEALRQGTLRRLPEDGTPVLNRVVRVMVARRLERAIAHEAFFAARDALLDSGTIGAPKGPRRPDMQVASAWRP